jgi:hypothetical protein
MILTRFSSKHMELLEEIEKKQKTTAREQNTYSPFAFYLNIGMLRKYGLVCEDGISDDRRKHWRLTKLGLQFLEYVRGAEKTLKKGESLVRREENKEVLL